MQILYERSVREVYDRHGQPITHLDIRLADLRINFIDNKVNKINFSHKSRMGPDFKHMSDVATLDLGLFDILDMNEIWKISSA